MRIDILTLFPEMFSAYLNESILKRAQESGRVSIHLHNIRDYTTDKHHITDLPPFGGGGGMILKAEPIFAAVLAVSSAVSREPVGKLASLPASRPSPLSSLQSLSLSVSSHPPHPPRPRLLPKNRRRVGPTRAHHAHLRPLRRRR
ncbi:MAG: hypothetical protein IPL78_20435 [Chloroflexi bacterium]|nr:hypothetical protein [Chloroflexota bacterium]